MTSGYAKGGRFQAHAWIGAYANVVLPGDTEALGGYDFGNVSKWQKLSFTFWSGGAILRKLLLGEITKAEITGKPNVDGIDGIDVRDLVALKKLAISYDLIKVIYKRVVLLRSICH